ncbi:hypothetical protein HU200_050228 [Digitaria exilis]|uniref:No apical meristem-associated C-terminal domain-containing protein n=1 Tax=Digitaria exilis TaxID=1010633 RepID=A0A835B328_9POAL|nr:hypothetical protein HU200_050228 [Digitaria exilis]
MLEAQARYARQAKGKACQFIHCWLQIRHSEKFAKAREQGNLPVQSNPTHDQAEGLQDSCQGQDSSIPTAKKARPPVRKKSKEKVNRDEGDDEYKIMMKNLMFMKTEEHKLKKEKWDTDKLLEQRRVDIEEWWYNGSKKRKSCSVI